MRRGLALVALAALAAPIAPRAAGAALVLENTSTGTALRVPLAAPTFEVVSHHSMYDAPVVEEFRVEDGAIVLVAVSSASAAAREYFGLTAAGDRHELRRAMPEVVFRIAAGTAQRLRAGGVERSFLDLGAHGDRLVLRAR